VKGTGFKDRVEAKLKTKEPKKEPEEDESGLKKKLARGVRTKVVEKKKDEESKSAIQAKSRQTVTQKELQADLKLKRL
jgi:hypothetical protein